MVRKEFFTDPVHLDLCRTLRLSSRRHKQDDTDRNDLNKHFVVIPSYRHDVRRENSSHGMAPVFSARPEAGAVKNPMESKRF